MTTPEDEVSLFELGASLLRHRWQIARWTLIGLVLAIVSTLFTKLSYTSTASFLPQAAEENSRSGLATLAGQLGFHVGGGGEQSNSPDFYADLLKSRVILAPIVADTFSVPEAALAHEPLLDLLKIKPATADRRLDLGVDELRSLENTMIVSKTGVIQVSVTTAWPSLSAVIAQRLLAAVNAFNLHTRQNTASEERRFTETRLDESRATLRGAEDRLQSFLQRNRQFTTPELKFDQDRLEREVVLDQQIVTSYAQAYEEVRIREVRNTPVITIIEPPRVPTVADPRGRVLRAVLGLAIGAVIGIALALVGDVTKRHRAAGDPDAEAFFRVLGEAKSDAVRLLPGNRKQKSQ